MFNVCVCMCACAHVCIWGSGVHLLWNTGKIIIKSFCACKLTLINTFGILSFVFKIQRHVMYVCAVELDTAEIRERRPVYMEKTGISAQQINT